ncbi:sialidase-1-like [Ornithodoros turicata]|uniref:sialidase-1-like n=1 Tax=Ornithodoros turicata TaxID=34597 RepID=UPI003138936C
MVTSALTLDVGDTQVPPTLPVANQETGHDKGATTSSKVDGAQPVWDGNLKVRSQISHSMDVDEDDCMSQKSSSSQQGEKQAIPVTGGENLQYNKPFTMVELLRALSSVKVKPEVVWEETVWSSLDLAPGVFRIPLITYTPQGHLLAFSEARKRNAGDDGPKFIASRRSEDRGMSWSPNAVIVDDGQDPDGLNLGAVVVDDETKHIFLIYTLCAHYIKCAVSSVMMISSTDDGLTWSTPRNLSTELGTKMFAAGPGTGIQKKFDPHKGRLIVCGHGTMKKNGVFCILSDDHGNTWRNGGNLNGTPYGKPKKEGDFVPDECQPYELPNGTVVINVRNELRHQCRCRIIVHSDDGCESIPKENVRFERRLPDPSVAAGVLYDNGITYFTNPASQYQTIPGASKLPEVQALLSLEPMLNKRTTLTSNDR